MHLSSFGGTADAPRRGRRTWGLCWPLLTLLAAYALHGWIVLITALGLAWGEGNPPFQCWGHTVTRGYDDYCVAAWGWWSPLLYLPELLLLATVISAVVGRSGRLLRIGALVTLGSLVVVVATLMATHGWAINEMPITWRFVGIKG